jgi:AraC family transcriptional regulator, transcriptional activator of pobA
VAQFQPDSLAHFQPDSLAHFGRNMHLNNLCQKYFSKTANQIIRERSASEIKKEIRYSEKSFSEIAYEFNFSAPSHFARFFKQMTGLSPQAYKEQLSNW